MDSLIFHLIREISKEFKTTFDYKNKFRANFIATEPLTLNENGSIEEELQVIIAAKRVDVIDEYAKKLKLSFTFMQISEKEKISMIQC